MSGQAVVVIRRVEALDERALDCLSEILVGVVGQGASVGWVPPMAMDVARQYWQEVLGPWNNLLVAEIDGVVVGTAQAEFSHKANGRHRAEVNKVLVHPGYQRRGIGQRLMAAVEDVMAADGRFLAVLDTREDDHSNALYQQSGYRPVSRIPFWAGSVETGLFATVHYCKVLEQVPGIPVVVLREWATIKG